MAIPELEQERASRALRRYCEKVPLEIRDRLTKDFRFVRSDIELIERRQHYLERDQHVEHLVAKLKYNARRGSWTSNPRCSRTDASVAPLPLAPAAERQYR